MLEGGQPGNKNATKNKRWREAIDKALKQYNEGEVKAGHALDKIAMRLVGKAVTGKQDEFKMAMQEIGDRIDGKAPQDVNVDFDMSSLPIDDLMDLFQKLDAAIDTNQD